MNIALAGIIIIVGNYGSGKTEISINLAVNRKRAGLDVSVADLDLVNPYFRTREARGQLSDLGIKVVLPPERYLTADLPILSPVVAGIIRQPSQLTILDVGGDDVGATVLSALADSLRGKPYRMLQVVNPFRPFTETMQGCQQMGKEIEIASKLTIDGVIGNANLIDDTTAENINEGYEFVKDYTRKTGLPLEFITVSAELQSEIDPNRFACPVLPIERQLVPPWKKATHLGVI
ncbi:cobalamin biosynthesis protein CbiA [Thermodesulfobacteriota bacterium]